MSAIRPSAARPEISIALPSTESRTNSPAAVTEATTPVSEVLALIAATRELSESFANQVIEPQSTPLTVTLAVMALVLPPVTVIITV